MTGVQTCALPILAFFGILKPFFVVASQALADKLSVATALAAQEILSRNWVVNFKENVDAKNRVKDEIDDYLFDEIKGKHGVELPLEQMDEIIEQILKVAPYWSRP